MSQNNIGKNLAKIRQEALSLGDQTKEKTIGYIVSALGLVAGLAWNDAVRNLIDRIYPPDKGGGLTAKFIYAVVITLIVVFVSVYLVKVSKKEKES